MTKQADEITLEIGRVLYDEFSSKFFKTVLREKKSIEEKLEDRFALFFEAMAMLTGGQSTPGVLVAQGVRWAPNTEKWRYQKSKTRNNTNNNFYQGITSSGDSFRDEIAGTDPVTAYGRPKIKIGSVRGDIAGSKKGLARINLTGNILQLDGKFASIDQVFNATLGLDLFSKVKNQHDLLDPFDGRVRHILSHNEGFGSGPKTRRPFLVPFAQYYSEVVMLNEFKKAAT